MAAGTGDPAIDAVIGLCSVVALIFIVFLLRDCCCKETTHRERQEMEAEWRESFVDRIQEKRESENILAAALLTPVHRPTNPMLSISTC
jgi:hypothetical protein|tara:strand:- start:1230 stop:1496 length:267 start_codon:yes stop_codon:yes gene_type:complete